MRVGASGRVALSRRATLALVAASMLLHLGALLWVLHDGHTVDAHRQTAAAPAPAVFGFFVRPALFVPARAEPVAAAPPLPVHVAKPRVLPLAAAPAMVAAPAPDKAAEARADVPMATTAVAVRAAEAAPAVVEARTTPPEIAVALPDHSQCPPAAYPMLLREQGIEGVVTLRVRVDALGRAAEVHLLQPSGWRLFDEAALRQVRACRFVPASRGGEPLASWVEFPVRFALAG